VVGVIEPQGRRIVAYGSLDKGDTRPLNGDTIFELARSRRCSRRFELADMVQRGEVALTDRWRSIFRRNQAAGARRARYHVADLSTHTSGLPRLPANMQPKDSANPYADYTVASSISFFRAIN